MLKRLISILLVIALASACVSTALAATLRKGSKGSEVTRLQNALKALGYYSLKVDGIYGKGTVAAVKAYQQSTGLKTDGIAGPYNSIGQKFGWSGAILPSIYLSS